MHSATSFFKTSIMGGALALGLAVTGAGLGHTSGDALLSTAHAAPAGAAQKVIVHVKQATDNLHAVSMALEIATEMAKQGAKVTFFVDLEGVRLADSRQPLGLRWGAQERTIGQLYDGFVAAGGEILVCPHCAAAVGLRASDLRKGARIGTFEQVAAAMLAADKVLDY
jgi:predicted peroxiredoxin